MIEIEINCKKVSSKEKCDEFFKILDEHIEEGLIIHNNLNIDEFLKHTIMKTNSTMYNNIINIIINQEILIIKSKSTLNTFKRLCEMVVNYDG